MANESPTIPTLKLKQTRGVWDLLTNDPSAFHVLTVVAFLAGRGGQIRGLGPNQALLTDPKTYGSTRQKTRSALARLEKYGFSTTKPTSRGTIVTIISDAVYEVIHNGANQQTNHQATIKQPSANHQANHQEPVDNSIPQTLEEKNFELARKAYPGKKRGFRSEFENFKKYHKDWKNLLDDDGLAQCIRTLIGRKAYSNGFWPMFQTFLNQSRYEEALYHEQAKAER